MSSETHFHTSKITNEYSTLIGKLHDNKKFNLYTSIGDEKDATPDATLDTSIIRSHAGRSTHDEAGTTNPASSVDFTHLSDETTTVNSPLQNRTWGIWPNNVLNIISIITTSQSPKLQQSRFHFDTSIKAAEMNWETLQEFENLGEALLADNNSFTKYGSEFRSTAILAMLLDNHPLWPRLSTILDNGINFPLEDLDFTTRGFDLSNRIEFGNHKGAAIHEKFYDELNISDIQNGYSIPIPLKHIFDIPGALTCPMNVIEQMTISESGEIIDKQRACHDLSFTSLPSNTSINSRVDTDQLQDCMFGHCIIRIIHFISALRYLHPSTPILIQKIDWKSAYRRVHLNWETAIQCCSVYKDTALIPLRAVFGGSPCPSEWSIISETTTDIANMLLAHPQWDPDILFSPNQSMISPAVYLPHNEKFASAMDMMVDIPTNTSAKSDVYIDDLITVALGKPQHETRSSSAVPLAIHTIGRPVHAQEPIRRANLMCFRKLLAEGRLEEQKHILGWLFNTRKMTIHLPAHKYNVWRKSILLILETRTVKNKQLETLIGRLTHMSLILPHILHFLGRLRRLQMSTTKRRKVNIKQVHVDDLNLMIKFLMKSHNGINMNLITFRLPTHVYFSDACPAGMGGYNHNGTAWRFKIPLPLQNRASINMLEHIASTIGPWLDLISNTIPPLSCSLSMTDNTTAAGWLRKSNFADDDENGIHMKVKMTIARDHATRILENDIREYSQWFPGRYNIIADALSRDFHLSNDKLTQLFSSLIPKQNQNHFTIVPLPPKIGSWICALLQQMPVRPQRREVHRPSTIEHGADGNNFLTPLICPMIHTWIHSQPSNESQSYQHSHTRFERQSILHPKFLDWVKTQSEIPWTMWHRPSGWSKNPTQGWTQMESLQRFYSNSSRATKKRTRLQSVKKPFPLVF